MLLLLVCLFVDHHLPREDFQLASSPQITIEIDDSEFTFTLSNLKVRSDPYVVRDFDLAEELRETLTEVAVDLYDALSTDENTEELERLLEDLCIAYFEARGYSVRRR